ncbi:DUF4932 domain-containing protein [Winogradskyella ursingii]|uniref:DUF4932 domain-containing protein n=1 Tax=Winogradskyella ursingii TaxID=2686079 RepID=UPI0015CB21FE|nr:DUF4932 domain-containing protein [Winogradskyella ursingii]
MRNLFIIILSLLSCQYSSSQIGSESINRGKVDIELNKNIELLGLAYFIGFEGVNIETKTVQVDGEAIPKKDWHNYGYALYQDYKSYATSANLAKSFSVANHLWLDYLSAFLMQVDEVPNAKLTDAIAEHYYLNFSKNKDAAEAKNNVEIFLEGMNAFSREINLEAYLSNAELYYRKMIEEVSNTLPNANFIDAMEAFYNTSFESYVLVPSLTIPKGMGFGIKVPTNNKTKIYSVFGALDAQEFEDENNLKMGFRNPEKLMELSIHEFGHSFVNPEVTKLPDHLFQETEHLFKPLKAVMYDQGYNTWKACVYEHFVRAGEIIIAEKLGDEKTTERLMLDYQEKRRFKYIPEILIELRKYDDGFYKSYYALVESTMRKLSKL